jgi:hypothetical protein
MHALFGGLALRHACMHAAAAAAAACMLDEPACHAGWTGMHEPAWGMQEPVCMLLQLQLLLPRCTYRYSRYHPLGENDYTAFPTIIDITYRIVRFDTRACSAAGGGSHFTAQHRWPTNGGRIHIWPTNGGRIHIRRFVDPPRAAPNRMVLHKSPRQAAPFTSIERYGFKLLCINVKKKRTFWQFDRDKRTVGLVFIIYRVLSVYVDIGLARWMCGHTFKLVHGRRRLTCVTKTPAGNCLRVRSCTKFSSSTRFSTLQYYLR